MYRPGINMFKISVPRRKVDGEQFINLDTVSLVVVYFNLAMN